jgi:hypothetical protein
MYKQRHIFQEKEVGMDSPRGCGFYNEDNNKNNLEKMIDDVKDDDNYLTVIINELTGLLHFDYERFVCEIHDIQEGRQSLKYPNIEFLNVTKSTLHEGRYLNKTATHLSYAIHGQRACIKNYFMMERNYTSLEFENEFRTEVSIASDTITRTIDFKCQPDKLVDLRTYLKVLKKLTVTPEIKIIFRKFKSDKSFLTQFFGINHNLSVKFTGKRCEVNSVVDLLNNRKHEYIIKKDSALVEAI